MESKPNESAKHPRVVKANCFMDCKNLASRTRDVITSLYSALLRLEYCIQFWSFQIKKNTEKLERVHKRASMIRGLQNLMQKESLKNLGLLYLEKISFIGRDLITVFQCPKVVTKEVKIFSSQGSVMTGQETMGECVRENSGWV